MMEMDALYCGVIFSRWEQFTGRKVKRYRKGRKSPA